MAMEHVWVVLDDGSRLRGDQIVKFGERTPTGESKPATPRRRSAIWEGSPEFYVEVFGTSASDRSQKICDAGIKVSGIEGSFLGQLYNAAARATEAAPQLLKTNESGYDGISWVIEPLPLQSV